MRKLTDKNRLSVTHPAITLEWDKEKNDLDPSEVSFSSHKQASWKCLSCSFKWSCRIQDRTRQKKPSGCPICSKKKQNPKTPFFLEERFSHLVEEWDFDKNKKSIKDMNISSNERVWWRCRKNPEHSWEGKVFLRTLHSRGCPVCASKIVDKTNCFANFAPPKLLSEWDHTRNLISPEEVSRKSGKTVFWICSKNNEHKWSAKINNRVTNGTGCPLCSAIRSAGEIEVSEYLLKTFSKKMCINTRQILRNPETQHPLELDIYFPEEKIAIEYNGEYWHLTEKTIKKDQTKRLLCEKKGIKLITIWENDWKTDRGSVEKMLKKLFME